jgi:Protein of unknown function (DUF2510)
MSIPEPTNAFNAPAGWYPTGETGPDGLPLERWWDGAQWSATIRPLAGGGSGPFAWPGGGRSTRAKSLIAAAVVVVLAAGGFGIYAATHNSSTAGTPSAGAQPTPAGTPGNGLGGGNGDGNGGPGGLGGGLGGLGGGTGGLGGATPTPAPTVAGGSGQTVSDPIDSLTIPVPAGWTGTSGSATGQGSWPSVTTGPYTCPSALSQANGSSSSTQCTRGGISFATASGTDAQSLVTSDIQSIATGNYGTLTSHSVVSQGAITVAGRAGYQITWSVVPNYSGPSGTVEAIAVPVPSQTGYFTVIDIGVDQSAQAPSLSSVNSQIVAGITDSAASGA